MKRLSLLVVLACTCLGFSQAQALAQPAPKPEDLKASVPALDAMHEVIMPLWHEAWPNKDVKTMAALLPAIERHFAALKKAELPMVLRDKQAAWASGLDEMGRTVAAYKAATASGDNEALLKAAERLHSQYEALVKTVRPVLKEMEDFHATLYVLYHYQLDPYQPAQAAASIRTLKVKMDALNAATLPDRLKAKTEAFNTQRARLSKTIDELVAMLDTGDSAKIRTAIELMHSQYENLERVF